MNLPAPTYHDELVSAAFFMEGLHRVGYPAVIQAWDQGAIDLVSEVVAFAPALQQMLKLVDIHGIQRAGVADYEIAHPFGAWLGQQIVATGQLPERKECLAWLAANTAIFFRHAPNAAAIRAVLAHYAEVTD